MSARLSLSYYDIKDSLWFRPAVMTLGAVVLAFGMLWIDHTILGGTDMHSVWLFEGSATGARGVLSAIAGTMMTVVTMAFSITMVALQLGSSEYSPRIMRNFTGDRGNQMVLGVFISTFVYCLLVLRSVRSKEENATGFVPSLSITVALILALLCIGSLIYFFHHATRTIQVSVILNNVSRDVFDLIEKKAGIDRAHMNERTEIVQGELPVVATVAATGPGYVRGIEIGKLASLATGSDLLLTVWPQVGDFVFTGTKLATIQRFTGVRPSPDDEDENGNGVFDEIRKSVDGVLGKMAGNDASGTGEKGKTAGEIETLVERARDAFATGMERTLNDDLLLGFRQLSDICIRALAPQNDPTTAMLCIDRIGEGLIRVQDIDTRATVAVDEDGTPRVICPALSFVLFLETSVQPVRFYATSDPFVLAHLARVLESVVSNAKDPSIRDALCEEGRRVVEAAQGANLLPSELMMVREAAAWAYTPDDHPDILRSRPELLDM